MAADFACVGRRHLSFASAKDTGCPDFPWDDVCRAALAVAARLTVLLEAMESLTVGLVRALVNNRGDETCTQPCLDWSWLFGPSFMPPPPWEEGVALARTVATATVTETVDMAAEVPARETATPVVLTPLWPTPQLRQQPRERVILRLKWTRPLGTR